MNLSNRIQSIDTKICDLRTMTTEEIVFTLARRIYDVIGALRVIESTGDFDRARNCASFHRQQLETDFELLLEAMARHDHE